MNLNQIVPYDISIATLSIAALIKFWGQISEWIWSIGGMTLNEKNVPQCGTHIHIRNFLDSRC
jgi:hypothetical protein